MKFRKEIIEKKKIRQAMGILLAVTMLLAGTPYTAVAADVVEDTDGTAYAQDAEGFVYQIPKGATTKKGCTIYMYTGSKTSVTFPEKCNAYTVTGIGTDLSQLILTNLCTVKIPSGSGISESDTAVPDRDPGKCKNDWKRCICRMQQDKTHNCYSLWFCCGNICKSKWYPLQ